jgi:hypothetical protein
MVGINESTRNIDGRGTSELLRGIPTQKEESLGATNPIPASAIRAGGLPRNGDALGRELRKLAGPSEKVRWLAGIPPEAFASIFRVEIDAELLQTMLAAMLAACKSADDTDSISDNSKDCIVDAAWKVLSGLVRHCPRSLSFAANFADSAERERVEQKGCTE